MILPPIVQRPPEWLTRLFSRFVPDLGTMEPFTSAHPQNFDRFVQLQQLLGDPERRTGCFAGAGISRPYDFPTWHEFLHAAADRMGLLGDVAPLLADARYEHAAQRLWDHDRERLQAIVLQSFRQERITPEIIGPASLLPFLRFDLLVTTNFDFVLDRAFQFGGLDPRPILYGASPGFARSAADEKLLPLLKIHGDYLVDENRVFTRKQYKRHYSRRSPLFSHLVQLFSDTTFLFVGFSLQDRKIRKALRRAHRAGAVPHFAILPAASPEEALERDASFTRRGVFPLWYVGDHGMVEWILGALAQGGAMGPDLMQVGGALQNGRIGDALPACERLVRARDGCHAFRMAYAWSLVESVDVLRCATDQDYADHAIARVDRAYQEVRDFPDALAVRAMLNHMRFNLNEAYEDATQAIEGGSQSSDALRALRGMYRLMHRGDREGAREDFAAAAAALPDGDEKDWMELYVAWIGVLNGEADALDRVRALLARPVLARELRGAPLLVRVAQPFYRIGWLRRRMVSPPDPRGGAVRLAVWAGRARFIGAWMRRWVRRKERKGHRKTHVNPSQLWRS